MTKDERYRRLFDYGCVACRIHNRYMYTAPQMHHIVNQSYREHQGGDRATLPLCPWHHEGYPAENASVEMMEQLFGPSLALNAKEFRRVFGSQRTLLAIVDKEIGAPPL